MSHEPVRGLYGHITHTDLVSRDPAATRAWCEQVFGWTFKPPFQSPMGEYHLFAYSAQGGGGIGKGEPPGQPGSTDGGCYDCAGARTGRRGHRAVGPVAVKKPPATIDAWLEQVDEDQREALQKLRRQIRIAAPLAVHQLFQSYHPCSFHPVRSRKSRNSCSSSSLSQRQ